MADSSEWQILSDKDIKEIKKYVEQNGVSKIDQLLQKKLEEWRDVDVSIGITGDSGAGKSSFINAIRG